MSIYDHRFIPWMSQGMMIDAAMMWNDGRGSGYIARRLGVRESDVYNHLTMIRGAACLLKEEKDNGDDHSEP